MADHEINELKWKDAEIYGERAAKGFSLKLGLMYL